MRSESLVARRCQWNVKPLRLKAVATALESLKQTGAALSAKTRNQIGERILASLDEA